MGGNMKSTFYWVPKYVEEIILNSLKLLRL